MSIQPPPPFPGWEEMYQRQPVEQMPWFYPELDDDIARAIDELGLRGGRALDLGSGPGTQSMQLVRRGFDVTASDISETAIRLAREKAEAQGLAIDWRQDNILDTRLTGPFDLIVDRGCFHVLPLDRRAEYVDAVAGVLDPGAYLFLKCFSTLQPGTEGPHRLSHEQIRELFERRFQVRSIDETVYQGGLDPHPRALFCVMRRSEDGGAHES